MQSHSLNDHVISITPSLTIKWIQFRYCFYLADQERRGGISPHTSPYARASDIAGLMQGAGYSLPTVDIDTIEISCVVLITKSVEEIPILTHPHSPSLTLT